MHETSQIIGKIQGALIGIIGSIYGEASHRGSGILADFPARKVQVFNLPARYKMKWCQQNVKTGKAVFSGDYKYTINIIAISLQEP